MEISPKHGPQCMCCQLGPEKTMNRLEEMIRQSGHAVIGTQIEIFPEIMLNMAYTVGLAALGLPEIIVFSVPMEPATVLLNDAADLLKEGKLKTGEKIDGIANMPAVFEKIDPEVADHYITFANKRAGKKVDAIQMIWPDPKGLFMWEAGYDEKFKIAQPPLFSIAKKLH